VLGPKLARDDYNTLERRVAAWWQALPMHVAQACPPPPTPPPPQQHHTPPPPLGRRGGGGGGL